jgi:hypothetical protein
MTYMTDMQLYCVMPHGTRNVTLNSQHNQESNEPIWGQAVPPRELN